MTAYTVDYYVNLALRDKAFGYEPDHPVVYATTVILDSASVPGPAEALIAAKDLAERSFAALNRVDNPVPLLDDVEAPSMSVGDVVHVYGPCLSFWLTVASVGFEALETDAGHVVTRGTRTVGDMVDDAIGRARVAAARRTDTLTARIERTP